MCYCIRLAPGSSFRCRGGSRRSIGASQVNLLSRDGTAGLARSRKRQRWGIIWTRSFTGNRWSFREEFRGHFSAGSTLYLLCQVSIESQPERQHLIHSFEHEAHGSGWTLAAKVTDSQELHCIREGRRSNGRKYTGKNA